MSTRISDGNLAASVVGTEKIPVGGASTPVITTSQIKDYVLSSAYLLASGGTASGPNIFIGTTTNIFKYVFSGLGTTRTDGAGHWLSNTTVASAGSQQVSPSISFEGQGWKTTATAESRSVNQSIYLLPVQGAANPTSILVFTGKINNTGEHSLMNLADNGSAGILTMVGSGNSIAAENMTASTTLIASTNFYVGSGISSFKISSSSGVATFDSFTTNNLTQLKINATTGVFIGGTTTPTAALHIASGTTGRAQIRLTPGVAPSSPNDGDIYYVDTNDRFMLRKGALNAEIISASDVTTEVLVSDTSLTITYNGTTYKLLARA
jgi:hypothetical protein